MGEVDDVAEEEAGAEVGVAFCLNSMSVFPLEGCQRSIP